MTDTTDTTDGPPALPAALPAGPPAPPPFWHRPLVERFLVPLLLPVAIVVGIIVYVLNVSRLFLAAPGHIAVVFGTIITVSILLGAALLSVASPKLRSSSIALLTVGFVLLVFSAGWASLGTSEEKKEVSTVLECGNGAATTLDFQAGPNGQLAFDPSDANATTGIARINVTDASAGEHTFVFDSAKTAFKGLKVVGAGNKDSCRAFFAEPGDYTFYCSVPGHRAAGMHGVIHVTGNPVTLAQAQAAAGGAGASAPTTKGP